MGDDVDKVAEGKEVDWSDVSSCIERPSGSTSTESWDKSQEVLNVVDDVNKAAKTMDKPNSSNSQVIKLYDLGCTHHILPYHASFTSLVETPPKAFRATNKQHFSATGIGELTVDIPNGTKTSKLHLTEVLYSPEVGYTLISVGKLNDLGYAPTFGRGKCTIYAPSGDTAGVIPKAWSGLYHVVQKADSAQLVVEVILLDQFHCWMSHITPRTAWKLVEKGFVTGIKLEDSSGTPTFCEACVHAKATQRPVARVHKGEQAVNFAGEVHSNLWGPAPVATCRSKKYYISFIDDKTCLTDITHLWKKDETLQAYKDFEAKILTQFNCSIKVLHSNWGSKYTRLLPIHCCRGWEISSEGRNLHRLNVRYEHLH